MQCEVCSVSCVVCRVKCVVYTMYGVLCSVQCTVFSVQCTECSVKCAVYRGGQCKKCQITAQLLEGDLHPAANVLYCRLFLQQDRAGIEFSKMGK